MIPPPGRHNCTVGRDDPFGQSRPRDIRLQVYISLTLGLGAFLAFCASPPHRTTHCASSNQAV
jgi:hypothetical protein